MNVKISVFVIYVKAIIYLLSYNLHGCTFKIKKYRHENMLSNENLRFLDLFNFRSHTNKFKHTMKNHNKWGIANFFRWCEKQSKFEDAVAETKVILC